MSRDLGKLAVERLEEAGVTRAESVRHLESLADSRIVSAQLMMFRMAGIGPLTEEDKTTYNNMSPEARSALYGLVMAVIPQIVAGKTPYAIRLNGEMMEVTEQAVRIFAWRLDNVDPVAVNILVGVTRKAIAHAKEKYS